MLSASSVSQTREHCRKTALWEQPAAPTPDRKSAKLQRPDGLLFLRPLLPAHEVRLCSLQPPGRPRQSLLGGLTLTGDAAGWSHLTLSVAIFSEGAYPSNGAHHGSL